MLLKKNVTLANAIDYKGCIKFVGGTKLNGEITR